jgi:ubiquinone biosynthesis O-methyltransferase
MRGLASLFVRPSRSAFSDVRTEHTVNQDEIRKFDTLSKHWWDPRGPLRLLHKMNRVRIPYIREQLRRHRAEASMDNVKFLDIGCGAGILSEPLARLGADVTGMDASDRNIALAKEHYARDPSLRRARLTYVHSSTTNYLAEARASNALEEMRFDAIAAMEVIEHVDQPRLFIEELSQLIRPEGMVFLSTINRTMLAKWLTIDLAESALGIVDRGTHDFAKYVSPEELQAWLQQAGLHVQDLQGITYLPVLDKWVHVPFTRMNYMIAAKKME